MTFAERRQVPHCVRKLAEQHLGPVTLIERRTGQGSDVAVTLRTSRGPVFRRPDLPVLPVEHVRAWDEADPRVVDTLMTAGRAFATQRSSIVLLQILDAWQTFRREREAGSRSV